MTCKLFLVLAIDRTSKFAISTLIETADDRAASTFLEHLLGLNT